MARLLLVPNPENVTIEKLKQLMDQPHVDILFADESGFEGDPRPRKRWDKKGSKTRVTKNGGHLRMNVIGVVCPRSGQFFAIRASHSDSATFQALLDETNKTVSFQRTTHISIEEHLLERLDQAILDGINNPKKTQKTACIGTLL